MMHRRSLLSAGCACLAVSSASPAVGAEGAYQCPPCGCAMDGRRFDRPGRCPACGMTLVPAPASEPPSVLAPGAGAFEAPGGRGREASRITVSYYRPPRYVAGAPILLVLPGAGRNANEYRDAWRAVADAKGVLIAALGYPETTYDFAAYQMAGVIRDLEIQNLKPGPDGALPAVAHLRDEDIRFAISPDPAAWLFDDFDRIFALVAQAAGSTRRDYDLFGHSAGGQILARQALFRPRTQARRIVAANAGFYTLPDLNGPAPVGLRGYGFTEANLAEALACDLTVLLGGEDDGDEAGGIQLHTPLIDQQGIGRLARGQTFFQTGRALAATLNRPFRWTLQVVPKVGHDYRAMSRAAAAHLYG